MEDLSRRLEDSFRLLKSQQGSLWSMFGSVALVTRPVDSTVASLARDNHLASPICEKPAYSHSKLLAPCQRIAYIGAKPS